MRRLVLGIALAAIVTAAPTGAALAAATQLHEGSAVQGRDRGSAESVYEPGLGEGVIELEGLGEDDAGAGGARVRRGEEIAEPEASGRERRRAGRKAKRRAAGREAEGEPGEAGTAEEGDDGALSSLAIGDGAATLGELEVPTALLPVYEACGTRYGISWEVLAAINKVETGFGTDLGTSGAGAEGWMQFLPQSWKEWGIDADGDGKADTDDPVDAICSAARYLAASGGESDIYDAVLAYNHADWYAREVLALARRYERVPANEVNALTELAAGSTYPVVGESSSWDGGEVEAAISGGWASEATNPSEGGSGGEGEADEGGDAATITGEEGAKVLAVVDGTVADVGDGGALGRYVVLTDPYGDRILYTGLGSTAVEKGASVQAGDPLGTVGEAAIGLSVRPDASTAVDPTELLEIWRQGGIGAVYDVDSQSAGEGSAAIRSLLMSAAALRREVLADADLELPRCVREAVGADELARQSLAALEYLTGRGYEIGVSATTCEHKAGFTLAIDSVDGEAVGADQGSGTAANSLVRTVLAMDASSAPQTVASATGIAAAETGGTGAAAIELDYRPPQTARIVDGDAIAPTDAPAAVQAIIAAANQIDETPYVWGGGHGAWVSDGYDCSGSVSYVLHAAKMLASPETSGALESWGESGSGRWVTVYANAEHAYAVIAGLRWDTVGDAAGTGPRWHTGPAYPAGFTVRHPAGY